MTNFKNFPPEGKGISKPYIADQVSLVESMLKNLEPNSLKHAVSLQKEMEKVDNLMHTVYIHRGLEGDLEEDFFMSEALRFQNLMKANEIRIMVMKHIDNLNNEDNDEFEL